MGLDDLLKKDREDENEKKRAEEAKRAAKNKADQEFRSTSNTLFNSVVRPALESIINSFQQNGYKANFGPQVHHVGETSTINSLSLNFKFRSVEALLTISSNSLMQTVNFSFAFHKFSALDYNSLYPIKEITKEVIDKEVEDCIKKLQNQRA
ncbi:hypothetical protein [Tellurirhabdus bombi]|uniref:hypothetical protein n=1 Tax=Tellurirhabdus bombi TaxID=2907205 RepID=UPI001F3C4997|nr:hypothetical protein [Tellurirhabdus bombi]